jgi:hypothetical protein
VFIREIRGPLLEVKTKGRGTTEYTQEWLLFRALPWLVTHSEAEVPCWSKLGNFRINRSLLTISANQPSIVVVRAARRGYRLYHQQPLQNAPLLPHGAAIKFRPRSIKDTPELTAVRSEKTQTVILIEGSRLWQKLRKVLRANILRPREDPQRCSDV